LRQAHGALGGIAEFARRFLLQRGGGERWRRISAALLAFDGDDVQEALRGILDGLLDAARRGLVGETELLDLCR
jgi:hypothetical protein